jgi:hypothetical protein
MPYGPLAKTICPEDYAYHCSAPDSTGHAHDAEDFLKCDGCGQLLCRLHASSPLALPYWHFCEACFRCVQCGERAWAACEECGDLRCQAHTFVQEPEGRDADGWAIGDPSYSCDDVCNCVLERRAARSEKKGQLPASGVA